MSADDKQELELMHFDGKVELTSSLRKQLQHNKTNTKVDITLLLTYCMNRTKRDKRRSDLELYRQCGDS